MVTIGILAAQGDFAAHAAAVARQGAQARLLRKPVDFGGLDGLVLPGGESTAMLHAIARDGLETPLCDYLGSGAPVFATCAGAILVARRVTNPPQRSFAALDIDVERNSYGTQADSFTATVDDGSRFLAFEAIFIRAPRIVRIGPGIEVLARVAGDPVLVRDGNRWAATFHPELTGDDRVVTAWLGDLLASRPLHVPRIGPCAEVLRAVGNQHRAVHIAGRG